MGELVAPVWMRGWLFYMRSLPTGEPMGRQETDSMHLIRQPGNWFGHPLLAPPPKTVHLHLLFLKIWKRGDGFFTAVLDAAM